MKLPAVLYMRLEMLISFFHQGRNTSPVKMSFQGLWISIEKNVQTLVHMKKYVEKQNAKLLKALKNQGFLAL